MLVVKQELGKPQVVRKIWHCAYRGADFRHSVDDLKAYEMMRDVPDIRRIMRMSEDVDPTFFRGGYSLIARFWENPSQVTVWRRRGLLFHFLRRENMSDFADTGFFQTSRRRLQRSSQEGFD
jgi:hypothetical protein